MRYAKTALPVLLLVVSLSIPRVASADGDVEVPMGTQVPLGFIAQFDSSTVKEGQAVLFTVASDVVVDRKAVIRKGASAQGLVVSVSPPGVFGRNARVHISFVHAVAVDGLPLKLSPVDITPGVLREARDTGGAAGASLVGLILLGPVGAVAGALVRGGHVTIPPGAVAVTATLSTTRVRVP